MMMDTDSPEIKSKSQVKRELLALQDLGRELSELALSALRAIPLADSTREAIIEGRDLRMGARQRHLKHVGKLLRDEDEAAIRARLEALRAPHRQAVNTFHEVERWRDALLAGDDTLLSELAERFADLDRQHLRQLLRNAAKEASLNKPPKSARAVFRYLKELYETEAH